ncbi:hypothetical protein PENTCL1PPCAC_26062 [Pristionchus entomophagus]|uniref:Uncharacterized protein n=1 Tax=Pristionchus entomophagus TaxID=358040 RepID=A0AAV5UB29_9BILA|nr:hypothetical protein PENTCL1PPCAC_26062 [Pristionchus entomophagus]
MQIPKWLTLALIIVAFPLQLTFAIALKFGLLFAVSIVAHIVYHEKVIKEGERKFKKLFFYYEVIVASVQVFALATEHLMVEYAEFWLAAVPMAVQVITCLALYVHVHQQPKADLPFFDNHGEKEAVMYRGFPVVHKGDMI